MNRYDDFLDIQYAWSNKDKKIFFIPEYQYTKENIERFNQIKDNNHFLSRAIDEKTAVKTEHYIGNELFREHGYYDVLLNHDYDIISYQRKINLIKKRNLAISEFKEIFVYNKTREKLFNDLIKLLKLINKYIKVTYIWVAGFYVEEKEKPNDIDVVIPIDKKQLKIIESDQDLYSLYVAMHDRNKLKKYNIDVHAMTLEENDNYLYKLGYLINLFSQKKDDEGNPTKGVMRQFVVVNKIETIIDN